MVVSARAGLQFRRDPAFTPKARATAPSPFGAPVPVFRFTMPQTSADPLGLDALRKPLHPPLDEGALDIADFLREDSSEADPAASDHPRQSFAALTLGAMGVVYGDIGTSPIYAFREALRATGSATPGPPEVLGILSLLIWTLMLIVTVKYVFVLLRADNRGEGGILALYTLVRLAIGRRSIPVLMLAIAGAALFAGDAAITPAISVLSAVEGMDLVLPSLERYVVPVTLAILVALFVMQARGTASVARLFGPVTVLWFLVMAGLGLMHISENTVVLRAFDPLWGALFLLQHPGVAFAVLGAVFLAVTGGEALYADLGHFGRKPITAAWFGLVLPALVLNYLGQGALVLGHPERAGDAFFHLAPEALLPWLVGLATMATVIASQAVISGAFSMARGAIQLGFLPRLTIHHTAQDQSGQIYIGMVNWALLAGVICLVLAFRSSEALASAYGIAVTGTMMLTTILGTMLLVRCGRMPLGAALVVVSPIALIETVFLLANLVKFASGGYVPVLIALCLGTLMWQWWRGTQLLAAKVHRAAVPLQSFLRMMENSSVQRIPGTAFFLTSSPQIVPSALLHNLKHNRVLHEQTIFLTVETLRVPYAVAQERASVEELGNGFVRLILRFGFMEVPNVSRAMVTARRAGLRFDVMRSTVFLGRRRPVPTGTGLGLLADKVFAAMSRFAADPTDYYHLPRDRVVELGERVPI